VQFEEMNIGYHSAINTFQASLGAAYKQPPVFWSIFQSHLKKKSRDVIAVYKFFTLAEVRKKFCPSCLISCYFSFWL